MTQNSANIFISYSRADRAYAERISADLKERGHEVTRDLDDILPTEEWRPRLKELITDADVVVFLLSNKSIRSEVCLWEIELAQASHKKIAPLVIEDVCGRDIPNILSRLNYIFATENDRFDNAVNSLCDAIGTDIEWLREHTRLTRLALRFSESRNKDDLLSKTSLADAERWLRNKPTAVPVISPYIQLLLEASRNQIETESQYNKAKLLALQTLVEPIIKKEIDHLKNESSSLLEGSAKSTFFRAGYNADAVNMHSTIQTLENFLAALDGQWHPKEAVHVKCLGPQEDYTSVYQYPCCNKTVLVDNPPLQYRADGCQTGYR